jgi:hypothetical protein
LIGDDLLEGEPLRLGQQAVLREELVEGFVPGNAALVFSFRHQSSSRSRLKATPKATGTQSRRSMMIVRSAP